MVSPEEAGNLCQLFTNRGIRAWLYCSWVIDALLGEHNRPNEKLGVEFPIEISRQRMGSSLGKLP